MTEVIAALIAPLIIMMLFTLVIERLIAALLSIGGFVDDVIP